MTNQSSSVSSAMSSAMSSEQYRQMLVRDGDRRFRDWHSKFLTYQQQFLAAMKQLKSR